MIYFVACPAANAVKIGVTRNLMNCLYSRVSVMQSGCPFPLEVLAIDETGYKEEEAALHLRFSKDRIRGECFRLTDELESHMAQFPRPDMPSRKRGPKSQSETSNTRTLPRAARTGTQRTANMPLRPASFVIGT